MSWRGGEITRGDTPVHIFNPGMNKGVQKTYSKEEIERLSEFHPLAEIRSRTSRFAGDPIPPDAINHSGKDGSGAWGYEEDWAGGIEITNGDTSVAYLQPGDEANTYLTDIDAATELLGRNQL